MWKILVTEKIHPSGLKELRKDPEVELLERVDMSEEEFFHLVKDVDALVTRSGTSIDKRVLDEAQRLKVVARAGVGVDNIDLDWASRKGVVVINAPTGNTLAATEHTFALLLSLCRKLPHAFNDLSRGSWNRKAFMGMQLHGKTLLIIGLGRIGSQVAKRAKAFGMEVLAYDPYISARKVEELGVARALELEGALALADVVTLHTPLTSETKGMIDERTLKAFKKGAILINCARGGLVEEQACADAIREGRLAGAAFDVFSQEPPRADHPLLAEDIRDKVVITPHIGANTHEAQSAVSLIIAKNLLAALKGEPYEHAVNLPFMEHKLSTSGKRFLALARKMGVLAASIVAGAPGSVQFSMRGIPVEEVVEARAYEYCSHCPYTIAALKGVLERHLGRGISYMEAPLLAQERGIYVEEASISDSRYRYLMELRVKSEKEEVLISATVTEDDDKQRIVGINGYRMDFEPSGSFIVFQNHDRPGVIGKIGTYLGERGINIANFYLGRKDGSGLAFGVLQVDGEVDQRVLDDLNEAEDFVWVSSVKFEGDR